MYCLMTPFGSRSVGLVAQASLSTRAPSEVSVRPPAGFKSWFVAGLKGSSDIGRSSNRLGTYSSTEGASSRCDEGSRKTVALDLRMQSDPREFWCLSVQTALLSPKRTFGGIPLTAMLAGGEHVATQEQYRWDR